MPQIVSWLNLFLDEDKIIHEHYPLHFLMALLDSELKDSNSSLLSNNLLSLHKTGSFESKYPTNRRILNSLLPQKYQTTLFKLSFQGMEVNSYIAKLEDLYAKRFDPLWLNAICDFLSMSEDKDRFWAQITKEPSTRISHELHNLQNLWQKNQVKFIALLQQSARARAFFAKSVDTDIGAFDWMNSSRLDCAKIIICQGLSDWEQEEEVIIELTSLLTNLEYKEIAILTNYYTNNPPISLGLLDKLVKELPQPRIKDGRAIYDLIHHYETNIQARNAAGHSKRHYAISAEEHKDLKRVLAGFKLKGQGTVDASETNRLLNLLYYTNHYSQIANLSNCPMETLINELDEALAKQKTAPNAFDKEQCNARILACLRELLLRKTGKWANHTQMLDLLFGACHAGVSLIHQMRTGQGKSIITLMRTTYLALQGKTVTTFSAKESLSKRDHEEFSHVLDALGIEHSYIEANSPKETFKIKSANGRGTINYATKGNFALFHMARAWKGENLNLDRKNMVAFIDEIDDILDDKTLYNFSQLENEGSVYNIDEWVFYVAYEYYMKKMEEGGFSLEQEVPILRRNIELQEFCILLQQYSNVSPQNEDEKGFFAKYLAPVVRLLDEIEKLENPTAEQKLQLEQLLNARDEQLMKILKATHAVLDKKSGLKEGVQFCIRPDSKKITDALTLMTRFAKVVVDNQVIDGSTYSDGVHETLHVRLNIEAVEKGETPNFFVEPESKVVLSSCVEELFDPVRGIFGEMEGCTGTAGDSKELDYFVEHFGIECVIKLPTHEERKTEYLPTSYADNEDKQVEEIVGALILYKDQPILVTCQDDTAVKRLSNKVIQLLNEEIAAGRLVDFDLNNLILDTNDSGKSEQQIVPLAGKKGAVTFSSRMGRGTDIQPYDKVKGLMVLRTYFAKNRRVDKQEEGRQGRNDAAGVCLDIVNYDEVLRHVAQFKLEPSLDKRFEEILQAQESHLVSKVLKPVKKGTKDYKKINQEEERNEKHTHMRAVQQLLAEIKVAGEVFLRRKERLIAILSTDVRRVLQDSTLGDTNKKELRFYWRLFLDQAESAWIGRLKGKVTDTEDTYSHFSSEVESAWNRLREKMPKLNSYQRLIQTPPKKSLVKKDIFSVVEEKSLEDAITFYQRWTEGASKNHLGANQAILNRLYGNQALQFNQFFKSLQQLSRSFIDGKKENTQLAFEMLIQKFMGKKEWKSQDALDELASEKLKLRYAYVKANVEGLNDSLLLEKSKNDKLIQVFFIDLISYALISEENFNKLCPLLSQDEQGYIAHLQASFNKMIQDEIKLIKNKSYAEFNQKRYSKAEYEHLKEALQSSDELQLKEATVFIKTKLAYEFSKNSIWDTLPVAQFFSGLIQQFAAGALDNILAEILCEFKDRTVYTAASLNSNLPFTLSCESWQKLLRRLEILSTVSTDYPIDLDSMSDYLSAFWEIKFFQDKYINEDDKLKEPTFSDFTEEDLKTIQLLFKLMLGILPSYLREPTRTKVEYRKAFLSTLSEAILARRKDKLTETEVDKMIALFTQNDKASHFLLSEHVTVNDLVYFLKVMLDEGKDPARLFAYIEQHNDNLVAQPGAFRPLLELATYEVGGFLPSPALSVDGENPDFLDEDIRNKFWNFLALRAGFSKEEYKGFIKELNSSYQDADLKEILTALTSLPSYLPLNFIGKQLDLHAGKNKYDILQRISNLKDIGERFKAFLIQVDIVDGLGKVKKPRVLKLWQQQMMKLSDINQFKGSLDSILTVHEKIERLTLPYLKANLQKQFAQIIDKASLQNKDYEGFKILVDLIDSRVLNDESVDLLLKLFAKPDAANLIKDCLKVIDEINKISDKKVQKNLLESYLKDYKDSKTNEIYLNFIQAFEKDRELGEYNPLLKIRLLEAGVTEELTAILQVVKIIKTIPNGAIVEQMLKAYHADYDKNKAVDVNNQYLALVKAFNQSNVVLTDDIYSYIRRRFTTDLNGLADSLSVIKVIQDLDNQSFSGSLLQSYLADNKKRDKYYQDFILSIIPFQSDIHEGRKDYYLSLLNSYVEQKISKATLDKILSTLNQCNTFSWEQDGIYSHFRGRFRTDLKGLSDSSSVIKAIKNLDNQSFSSSLLQIYLQDSNKRDQYYQDFILSIMPFQSDISEDRKSYYLSLLNSYLEQKINKATLDKILSTLNQCNTFSWEAIKDNFRKDSQFRQNMMIILHHDLLYFPGDFKQSCHDSYAEQVRGLCDSLALAEIDKTPVAIRTRQENYKTLVGYALDVAVVAKPLQQGMQLPIVLANNLSDIQRDVYKDYFKEQKVHYASFWGKNSLRKEQAKVLFKGLKSHVNDLSMDGVNYESILNLISEAQKDIIERDKNSKRNDKGHSRLLDITSDMYIRVASDWMASSHDLAEKERLNGLLKMQLETTLEQLISRLGETLETKLSIAPLKANLTKAKSDIRDKGIDAAAIELNSPLYDKLPSHLKHLVEYARNLAGVVSDGNQASIQQLG
ncbi:MAG: hypothetical protein LCH30_02455 [Proteobacteria bacterium]|nr:hypothetical protein [Pseudomonadota bacterium]